MFLIFITLNIVFISFQVIVMLLFCSIASCLLLDCILQIYSYQTTILTLWNVFLGHIFVLYLVEIKQLTYNYLPLCWKESPEEVILRSTLPVDQSDLTGAESRRTAAISSVKSGVFAGDADSALCLSSVHTSLSREAKVTLRRDRCHLRTEEGHLCLYTLLIGLFFLLSSRELFVFVFCFFELKKQAVLFDTSKMSERF